MPTIDPKRDVSEIGLWCGLAAAILVTALLARALIDLANWATTNPSHDPPPIKHPSHPAQPSPNNKLPSRGRSPDHSQPTTCTSAQLLLLANRSCTIPHPLPRMQPPSRPGTSTLIDRQRSQTKAIRLQGGVSLGYFASARSLLGDSYCWPYTLGQRLASDHSPSHAGSSCAAVSLQLHGLVGFRWPFGVRAAEGAPGGSDPIQGGGGVRGGIVLTPSEQPPIFPC